ncbi:hypothetical protein QYE76_058070 [Lolium multiflorum]|uniref:Calmodulin-binding domain-containing protein n=1 Tax=Lolium multiflorum TaxID=4521 RepID=A0AAD8WPN0_LOLMU|nr:hypothetical protein QYE76_058070 [Lolium multiflorum]
MVHCKQARRRPKGAADAPKNGERGPLPGYMRPTSSSGARAGRESSADPSATPLPERDPAAPCARTPSAARATCSSALKSALARGCGGEARVCRYAYCSLKGHAHAPVAPPLGTFVEARRRLIKTEQRMKHRGVSAFRNTNTNNAAGLGGHGFFVQACPNAGASVKPASSGSSCSGLSTAEMEAAVAFGRREAQGKWSDPDGSVDGSCGSSDVISDGLAQPAATVTARPRRPKDGIDGDGDAWGRQDQEEAEDSGGCRSDISEELGARYQGNTSSKDHGSGVTSVESSMDDISSAFGGMCFEDAGSEPTDAQRNKLTMSRRGTAPRDEERIRPFNPRAPNFLQVEPGPDAEKVDLRHQEADDRKNAEEWMVDYALRRTVKKLARAQKRKVEMLVQAFEAVLPPVPVWGSSWSRSYNWGSNSVVAAILVPETCSARIESCLLAPERFLEWPSAEKRLRVLFTATPCCGLGTVKEHMLCLYCSAIRDAPSDDKGK